MSPIDTCDGFLAGLIAGDGSFEIHPNNGGQSWTCGLSIALRDDDMPLLQELSSALRCGTLRRVKARNTSKPQIRWRITRMSDCAAVSTVLLRSPLISKKAGEFEIWRRAVEIWSDRNRDSNWQTAMRNLARQLRRHRRFSVSPPPIQGDITSDYLDHFLAGFATAEGHFGATVAGTPIFGINLRADDTAVLEYLRDRLDVGYVVVDPPASYRRHAVASWRVARRPDVIRVMTQFDRVPPRGRKGITYEAWRELVLATSHRSRRVADPARRRQLATRVRATREYRRPRSLPLRRNATEESRARCTAALLAWAAVEGSSLTATAYERYRSAEAPDAPDRNTIARNFGSWRSALESCKLPTTGCRSARTLAVVRARRTRIDRANRGAQRAAITRAIRRCRQHLGRWPTATEFFRWRLEHSQSCPSQGTIYRTFTGRWVEVLRAARGRVT